MSCCGVPLSQSMVLQTLESREGGQRMSAVAEESRTFVVATANTELEFLANNVHAVRAVEELDRVDAVACSNVTIGAIIIHFVGDFLQQARSPGTPAACRRAG